MNEAEDEDDEEEFSTRFLIVKKINSSTWTEASPDLRLTRFPVRDSTFFLSPQTFRASSRLRARAHFSLYGGSSLLNSSVHKRPKSRRYCFLLRLTREQVKIRRDPYSAKACLSCLVHLREHMLDFEATREIERCRSFWNFFERIIISLGEVSWEGQP